MKKPQSEVRNKLIVVRLNAAEFCRLNSLFKATTERHLSNYIRKVMLQKPVIVTYRNRSLDDFLREMFTLQKELTEISNHFHQAVKKLSGLEAIPEFRTWIEQHHNTKDVVEQKIGEIKSKVAQLYAQWLSK